MDYSTATKQELLDEMKRLMDSIGAKVSIGIKTPFLDLPQILLPGEEPVGIFNGTVNSKVVLVVLTNLRLISHYKGPFGGSETSTINLHNAVSVDSKSGLLTDEVTVTAGSAKMKISGIEKTVAPKLISLIDNVQTSIPEISSALDSSPAKVEPSEVSDVTPTIEKKAEVSTAPQVSTVQHTGEKKNTSKLKIAGVVLIALVAIGLFAGSDDEPNESTTSSKQEDSLPGYSIDIDRTKSVSSSKPIEISSNKKTDELKNQAEAPEYLTLDTDSQTNKLMTAHVLIREKVSEDALKSLALKVCEDNNCKKYKKTTVFVYLPGMKPESAAWASAMFLPKLEIGLTGINPPHFNLEMSDDEVKKQVVKYHREIVRIMSQPKKRECGFAEGGECRLVSIDAREWKTSIDKFIFLYARNNNVHVDLRFALVELRSLALNFLSNDQKEIIRNTITIQEHIAKFDKWAEETQKKAKIESKALSKEEFDKRLAQREQEQEQRIEEETKLEKSIPTLGITVEEFETRYNRFLSDYAADGGIARFKPIKAIVVSGEKTDTMIACPTKRTCVVAPVLKHTKKLQRLMVNGTTDGSKESTHALIWNMVISCSAAATSEDSYQKFITVADVALKETDSLDRGRADGEVGYKVTRQEHPAFGLQVTMTRAND